MKGIIRSLLVILLFILSGRLISQDVALDMGRVYGLDPLLYNGKKYSYFMPHGTGGNQFLTSTDYYYGEVTIRGKRFEGVSLNYDIYNQQLLLQYMNESGAGEIIEISKAWLESFRLDNMLFRYLSFEDGPRFYQVLGEGPLFILYYYRKDLKLDYANGTSNFAFTPPKKSRFVLIKDKFGQFGNNRGFVSLFDPSVKTAIRGYIRDKGINVKKASDQTMTELINYIGNL
jgi:hypothetical protein